MRFIESQLPEVQRNAPRDARYFEACQGLLAFVDSMIFKWTPTPAEVCGSFGPEVSVTTPYAGDISLEWRMPWSAFHHDPARRWPLRAEILAWRGIERVRLAEERGDPLLIYRIEQTDVSHRDPLTHITTPLDTCEVNKLLGDLQDSAQWANEMRRANPEPQS